jgi:hypothetical protein
VTAADHLNPRQHHEYLYTHDQDQSSYGTRFDEYKLIRRSTTEQGDVSHAQVGNLTVTRYKGQPEHIGKTPAEYGDTDAYDEDWYRDYGTSTPVTVQMTNRYGDVFHQPVGRQGRLFDYAPPVAGEHKVDTLVGTEGARAPNMVMLGIAENAARAEGTSLLPSEDLSKHSSRLVGHLKGTGAVSEHASTRVTNEIQFSPEYDLGPRPIEASRRLPEAQVEAGRKTVREVMKGSRARKPRGQGTLF